MVIIRKISRLQIFVKALQSLAFQLYAKNSIRFDFPGITAIFIVLYFNII